MRRSRPHPGRPTTLLRREALTATVPVALAALLAAAGPASADSAGAPGAGDPYFPLAGNGGYHVTHYELTLRYDTGGRHLDGCVARRTGLVFGQGPIGGAEPQRQGQRGVALADLWASVHVEDPDVLEQFTRAVAHRVDHRLRGDVVGDDQAHVLEHRRER